MHTNDVETAFDFVVKNGNNVERNFVLSTTKSKQIEQRTGSNLFRLCRKNRSTCSIRQCCFDIVAGVDGALDGSMLDLSSVLLQ